MAEILAANQITIAKVLDGADGEMSAEQLAQLNQASEDASQAKTTAKNAQTSIDNFEIGGRNYVLDSDKYISGSTSNNYKYFNLALTIDEMNKLRGKAVTISVDIKLENVVGNPSTSYQRVGTEGYCRFEDGTYQYFGAWRILGTDGSALNENIRISKTITIYAEHGQIISLGNTGIYTQGISSGTATVGRPKIEIGNRDTDWTPAPEDVQAEIDKIAIGGRN